jgi:Flp pilus assembly protein TadG
MPMLGKSMSLARRLTKRREGNIAIMFGLSAFALIFAIGLAVDISRGYTIRTKLNAALDDAGLALGSSPGTWTTTQLNQRLQAFVQANYPGGTLQDTVGTPTFSVSATGTTITVTGTANVPTVFMRLAQVNNMSVSATSVITKGIQGLELAVVLDNTGSMLCGDGGGCTTPDHESALVSATQNDLLTPIFNNTTDTTKLKVALVPYVTTVNVGPALASKGLLSTAIQTGSGVNAGKYTDIHGAVINDFNGLPITFDATQTENTREWKGCVIEPTLATEDNTSPPVGVDVAEPAGGWTTPWIAFYWPPNALTAGSAGYNNWYLGATVSGNTRPIGYPHTPGGLFNIWQQTSVGPNNGCPTAMLRLQQMDAAGQATVNTAVANLQAWAAGGTMVHMGMIWGWRALSPNPPFADGVPYAQATGSGAQWIKAVVLETDGAEEALQGQLTGLSYLYNVNGNAGPYLLGSSQNQTTYQSHLDTRLQTVCNNMKAQGIVIYTVGFGSGAASNTALVNCAGNGGKYIAAANAASLSTAFQAIAQGLNTLRLAQ